MQKNLFHFHFVSTFKCLTCMQKTVLFPLCVSVFKFLTVQSWAVTWTNTWKNEVSAGSKLGHQHNSAHDLANVSTIQQTFLSSDFNNWSWTSFKDLANFNAAQESTMSVTFFLFFLAGWGGGCFNLGS